MLTYDESDWERWAAHGNGPPPGWDEHYFSAWLDVPDYVPDDFPPSIDEAEPCLESEELAIRHWTVEQVRDQWAEWAKGELSGDSANNHRASILPLLVYLHSHGDLSPATILVAGRSPGAGKSSWLWSLLDSDSAKAPVGSAWSCARPRQRLPSNLRKLPQWAIDLIVEVASRTLPIPVLISIRKAVRSQTAIAFLGYDLKEPRPAPFFGELAITYAHHASAR